MLFYIILILVVWGLTMLLPKKNANGGYFIASLILTVIAVIRYDVGWDYWNYYTIVDDVVLAGLAHFEPFFLLLCLPAIYLNEPFLLFLLSGLIIYPLTFIAFKQNSISPSFSLIIYVGLFYLVSCSIVRQAIAISLCLYAFKYVKQKSFVKFFLMVLVGMMFHYSAIVSLIIYPIFQKANLKKILILIFVALAGKEILFMLLENYGLYTNYLSRLNELEGGRLTRCFYILIFLSFFVVIKKKFYSEEEIRYLSIISIGLICPYLFGASMGERIGYYFLIYYCYAIPLLLRRKKHYKRCGYVSVFVLYFLFTIYYTSNIPGQKSAYTPYQTIFNSKNIEFRK